MTSPSLMYRELLRRDLPTFSHRAFVELQGPNKYRHNWHLDVLAAKLEDVRMGRCKRLIVNIPPRHLKSHLISTVFPAWVLGHDPTTHVMWLSYAQDVSDIFGRQCRKLMTCPFYRATFDTRLSPDRQAVADFETTAGGSRFSTSVGGVVTSRGGDIIIIDDPIKAGEAVSDARRDSLNQWYDNTLRSRLNYQNEGAIVLVMQRLHTDDLVAHVQKHERWEVISIPAVAFENAQYDVETPLGRRRLCRQEGDVLQPDLMSKVALESLREGMTEYNFAAQYQQLPVARDGNVIKTDWLRYYSPGQEPEFSYYFQSWDTANSSEELRAYSVCTTWGVFNGNRFYLLDVFRRRLNYPDLKRAVVEQHKNYPRATIIIEEAASGQQLIQEFKGAQIKPYKPILKADKLMRLEVQAVHFENGRVFLPEKAAWLHAYLAELTGFPNTQFSDQVDSTTQFLDYWLRAPKPVIISEEDMNWARTGRLPVPRSSTLSDDEDQLSQFRRSDANVILPEEGRLALVRRRYFLEERRRSAQQDQMADLRGGDKF